MPRALSIARTLTAAGVFAVVWVVLVGGASALAPELAATATAAPSLGADLTPPLGEGDLPWCVSAEDPRCAPVESPAPAPLPTEIRCLLADGAPARVPARTPSSVQQAAARGTFGERAGVTREVERPPRALRRPS